MNRRGLSFSCKKALMVNIGEDAAQEIFTLINQMSEEIDFLRRNKVDVTHIVPEKLTDPLEK